MPYNLDHHDYTTKWEQIPAETREQLVLTGPSASDYLRGEELEDKGLLWAYAEQKPDIPETPDGQLLTIILVDELPAYQTMAPTRIVDMDILVTDYREINPRGFQTDIEESEDFRFLVKHNTSPEIQNQLIEHFSQEQYSNDRIRPWVEELEPQH